VGEFGERGGDPWSGWGVDAELVVAASKVLHEGVSGDGGLGVAVRSPRIGFGRCLSWL
jgi:hypothetical protein